MSGSCAVTRLPSEYESGLRLQQARILLHERTLKDGQKLQAFTVPRPFKMQIASRFPRSRSPTFA